MTDTNTNVREAAAIGGGVLPQEVEKKVIIPGSKGFATNYATKMTMPMRVLAECKDTGCYFVSFFDGNTPQHTRGRDIRVTKVGVEREEKRESKGVSPFVVGEKVWAREIGKEWKRGRVIKVYGEHECALVKFFHETGHPSQNTKFSEISKEKPV